MQKDNADNIISQGKNWYAYVDNIQITANAYSYTIITAHREKVFNTSSEQ